MDKKGIFSVCLSIYNIDYDSVLGGNEELYCELFLQAASDVCGLVKPWPFLIKSKVFEGNERLKDDDGAYISYRNLQYGYKEPDDMAYPYLINGRYDEFTDSTSEGIFFAIENPRVDYVSTLDWSKESTECIDLYGRFIASQLAVQIGPMIAPDSNAISKAATLYTMYQSALTEAYLKIKRKKTPEREHFII